jgi:hypothetical protein
MTPLTFDLFRLTPGSWLRLFVDENYNGDVSMFQANFNAANWSKDAEIWVARKLGGKTNDSQEVFDIEGCTNSPFKKCEVRNIVDNLFFGPSTDIGKNRPFSEANLLTKLAGNDAFVVVNFLPWMASKAATLPLVYGIPTSRVKELYDMKLILNGSVHNETFSVYPNTKRARPRGFARGSYNRKMGSLRDFIMTCDISLFRPSFDDLFPHEFFHLDVSGNVLNYPTLDQHIERIRARSLEKNANFL